MVRHLPYKAPVHSGDSDVVGGGAGIKYTGAPVDAGASNVV